MSMSHSFDILLAAQFGVEEAILIHHFQHWIRFNRRESRNIKDGHCWTYQSRKDIAAHFPYWNEDRVKYLCEKLVDLNILVTANYNKIAIDKTLWYAFVDEKAFGVDQENSNNLYERQKCPSTGKSAFPEGKSAQAIPDTKPNTKSSNTRTTTIKSGPEREEGCSSDRKIPESVSGANLEYTRPDGTKQTISISDIYRILLPNNYANEEIVEAIKIARTTQYIGDAIRFLQGTVEKRRQKYTPSGSLKPTRYIPGNNNVHKGGETIWKARLPQAI